MSPKNFTSSGLPIKLSGAALLALMTWHAHAQWAYPYDPDWQRTFRAGVLVGFNISADFSMKGSFGISSSAPGLYDDGYVRRDAGGALTSDWGYNTASQYNPGTATLTMHKTTSFSTTSATSVNDPVELGVDLAYGGTLWRGERMRIGWELGFGYLPIKIADKSTLSATVKRSAYTFDASGFDPGAFPPAGYRGIPNASGNVALISSSPSGAPVQQVFNNVQITGNRTLDLNFFAVKLGPTLFWDLNHYIGLSVGAGPAIGIVTGNLKFDETINFPGSSARNIGEIGSTELTYGGYVNAMLTFHTVKNGDFYIGAQYMPMGKVDFGGSGRHASLDLSGQVYLMAGINWPF